MSMQQDFALSWDRYFLDIAGTVSGKSHCLSKQRGCIIVRGKQILSTGYNGPPTGFYHCDDIWYRVKISEMFLDCVKLGWDYRPICPRKIMGFEPGKGLEYCPASHAEDNAIVQAAKNGISVKGGSLYCSFAEIPCRECVKSIINAGIREIVLEDVPVDYSESGIAGKFLLERCGVKIRGENDKG